MPEITVIGRVEIEKDRCKGCELCIDACPKGVLEMSTKINSKGYFYADAVHPEKCTGCALCAMSCPDVAIEVYK